MAMDATIASQQASSKVKLGRSCQGILVALTATGLNVARWKNRRFAIAFAMMCLCDSGSRSLSSMTDHATESIHGVRNSGMLSKGLLMHVCKASFVERYMTGRAAIHNAKLRQPSLMNAWLKAAPETRRIGAIANQCQIAPLIAVPLAEVLLGWSDGKRKQQYHADCTECADRIAEERAPHGGEILYQESHLTPPGQDPGPSRATKPCTHGGEHNEFKKKPRHDPICKGLRDEVAAPARR